MLIPMLLCALVTLAGVILLATGLLKKSRTMPRAGIGLIATPWALVLVLGIVHPGIDEWNPEIESDSQVWDHWEGDGYAIDLKPEGSFVLSAKGEDMRGHWKRDDWNLHLTGDDGETRRMRFVEDRGHLLLQTNPRGPDHDTGPLMRRK